MVHVRLAWIPVGCLLLGGCAAPRQAALDLNGSPINVFAAKPASVTVLLFVSNDCPIANRYAPEIQRLHDRFACRGAAFWLVHADPSESPVEIQQHARLYHLDLPLIRDPHHQLTRLAKAEVTPSAAVFFPGRKLIYHGRIDDRFVELGRERPEAMNHDLAEAIEAALSHKRVPVSAAKAVGCYIPSEP